MIFSIKTFFTSIGISILLFIATLMNPIYAMSDLETCSNEKIASGLKFKYC